MTESQSTCPANNKYSLTLVVAIHGFNKIHTHVIITQHLVCTCFYRPVTSLCGWTKTPPRPPNASRRKVRPVREQWTIIVLDGAAGRQRQPTVPPEPFSRPFDLLARFSPQNMLLDNIYIVHFWFCLLLVRPVRYLWSSSRAFKVCKLTFHDAMRRRRTRRHDIIDGYLMVTPPRSWPTPSAQYSHLSSFTGDDDIDTNKTTKCPSQINLTISIVYTLIDRINIVWDTQRDRDCKIYKVSLTYTHRVKL